MWIYEWHAVAALSAKFAIKNPAGVNRRSETVPVTWAVIGMIAGVEATVLLASRLSPNVVKASELVNQPPGSDGNCSRPVTTKLLACPLAKAAQRCVKRLCAWLGSEGKVPRLSLKLDVGLWIVTLPFTPNCDEASTWLPESAKNRGVVRVMFPPPP